MVMVDIDFSTSMTLSNSNTAELAGAIHLIDKFQVEGFLSAKQKQTNSAGKRGFFSKRSVGPQHRDKFTSEDMLCFHKAVFNKSMGIHVYVCIAWHVKLARLVEPQGVPYGATENWVIKCSLSDNCMENGPWHGVGGIASLLDEVNKLITITPGKRETCIISLYYDFDNECLTWEDIGKRIGLSKEGVKHLALDQLKHVARKTGLEEISD